jgi:hypothetical protein
MAPEGRMVAGTEAEGPVGSESLAERDRIVLEAFSRRTTYWTTDVALVCGHRSTGDAYRALERLEERHLVQRVVRLDPISWRRTELGDIIAAAFPVSYRVAS